MKTFTIFITDDDDDDFLLLSDAFKGLSPNYHFKHLKDGEELINTLIQSPGVQETLPDMIILDYNMPRKNGLDTLIQIRKDSNLMSTPVIIYSTSNSQDLHRIMIANGANGFVTKNCSIYEMDSFVRGIDSYLRGTGEMPGKNYKNTMPFFSSFRHNSTFQKTN